MNNKIFGIIACILLITSYITIAENVEKTSTISLTKKISNTYIDDVPIWTKGNSWSYKIDNMIIDYEQEGQLIHLILETSNLQLNVIEVSTDSYITKINASLRGSGYIYVILDGDPVNITMDLKDTKLTGTIVFNKSDLGIKELNPILVGRLIVDIIEQPYTDKPIPKLPIRATINVITSLSTPLTIIDFPLNVSSIWGISSSNISINGTLKSPWLYLMYFVNNLARSNWNLSMKLALAVGIDEVTAQKISDMLLDILPIINISYVLQQYLEIGNVFETPEIPPILLCDSFEEITVQGKPYNAYNISVIGGLGNIYYAPSAGNIVKISGHFKDIIPFISDLNIELMETNFQP
jgi:hypothetical protein